MGDQLSAGRRLTQPDEVAVEQYRGVSVAAVVCLVLGLFSPLTLLSPVLWFVPICAFACGGLAWWRIARSDAALIGRMAALAGVALAIFFLAAAVAEQWTYRRLLLTEARQFGEAWFGYLAADRPQQAFALSIEPKHRPPLEDEESLRRFYRSGPRWRNELEGFVQQRLPRTLLALGPRAEARFVSMASQQEGERSEIVQPVYAVTYDENGQRKSFFVQLTLEKTFDPRGPATWRLVTTDGNVRPPE